MRRISEGTSSTSISSRGNTSALKAMLIISTYSRARLAPGAQRRTRDHPCHAPPPPCQRPWRGSNQPAQEFHCCHCHGDHWCQSAHGSAVAAEDSEPGAEAEDLPGAAAAVFTGAAAADLAGAADADAGPGNSVTLTSGASCSRTSRA